MKEGDRRLTEGAGCMLGELYSLVGEATAPCSRPWLCCEAPERPSTAAMSSPATEICGRASLAPALAAAPAPSPASMLSPVCHHASWFLERPKVCHGACTRPAALALAATCIVSAARAFKRAVHTILQERADPPTLRALHPTFPAPSHTTPSPPVLSKLSSVVQATSAFKHPPWLRRPRAMWVARSRCPPP